MELFEISIRESLRSNNLRGQCSNAYVAPQMSGDDSINEVQEITRSEHSTISRPIELEPITQITPNSSADTSVVVIYHESRTPIPRQPFVAWTPRIGKWSRVWRPGMHARVTEKSRSTPGHMSRGPHELASGRVDWRLDIPRVCPRRRRVTLR